MKHINTFFTIGMVTVAMFVMASGANLLTNPSFETGDLTGWNGAGGEGATVGAPGVGAQDGSNALCLVLPGAGVSEVRQSFPANPGDEFNFSGFMLTENAIGVGPSFGLFKIVFQDASGTDLEPASISIGQAGPSDNPGVESLPFLNDASPLNTWFFSEAQGVAPVDTTQVVFLGLNVDFAPGNPYPMWFDNIQASLEPGGSNLIQNGSFETGDLAGWSVPGGSGSVAAPGVGAQDGNFAVVLDSGGNGVAELNQKLPASPGDEFNMSGYMLTESALPAGATFGLFKIVFQDAANADLEPDSISIGNPAPPENPGIESTPFLNDANAVDTWIFSEAQGVAPAGTTQVVFLALNVDFAGGANPMWFDNLQASLVTDTVTVAPTTVTPTEGDFVAGDAAALADSDGVDYQMRRRNADLQSRTEFTVKSNSPTETPSVIEFTLEGNVFARGNVVQTIELFDYNLGVWELVDTSNANRSPMPDKVVTATPTGDLSRFVEAGTMCIEARIRYKSDRNRQKFASNTDQTVWSIQ